MELESGYSLINPEKVDRALNGLLLSDSTRKGGVGKNAYNEDGVWKRDGIELSKEEIENLETALIAEYDKFGGAIYRGDDKVKMGSFWDFKGRKAREIPQIEFVYRFGNKIVTVPDGQELPGEIKAQKILKKAQIEEEEEEKPKKKAKRIIRK